MKLNIIDSNISIDRDVKSNKSMSAFISTDNIKYPITLNPKSELPLGGKFVSKDNGIHYLDLWIYYSMNNTKNKLTEFHEVCKVNVLPLQFDSSSQIQGNINSLIAVVGAIAGGSIGSYFTYRYGRRIEEEKAERENKKVSDLNTKIRELVRSELNVYIVLIGKILEKFPEERNTKFITIDSTAWKNTLLKLNNLPKQYNDIPIETKAKAFEGQTLTNVEAAYQGFSKFAKELEETKDGRLYRPNIQELFDITDNAVSSIPKDKD